MDELDRINDERPKLKVSIYIDKELWTLFKNYSKQRDIKFSNAVAKLIKNELSSIEAYSNAMKKLGIFFD